MGDESSRRQKRLQIRAGEEVLGEVESAASPYSLAGIQRRADTQGAARGQAKMQLKGLREISARCSQGGGQCPVQYAVALLGSSTKR